MTSRETLGIWNYSEAAERTLAHLEDIEADNLHMVMGIATEAGELMDIFKKNHAYNKPIDWVNAEEEVGDLMWYIANFCTLNGFDLINIMDKNIRKLKARYPDKFDDYKAVNRDLETERKILEG